ncbi:MAG: hypothetical protein JWQ04_1456 [Pedosphaera sp.]|nr:hypothetical protein [Pedosphaera sp.]
MAASCSCARPTAKPWLDLRTEPAFTLLKQCLHTLQSENRPSTSPRFIKNPIGLPISDQDRKRFFLILGNHPDLGACHIWPKGTSGGRGRFWLQGETRYAYRVAWLLTQGEIPPGMDIISICRNLACCNVKHYRLGVAKQTTEENLSGRFVAKIKVTTIRPYSLPTPCWSWIGSMEKKDGYALAWLCGLAQTVTGRGAMAVVAVLCQEAFEFLDLLFQLPDLGMG